MEIKKLTLFSLVWPIMIELFLQFMIGTADTLMVSRISDDAVAVVGLSNQFFQSVIVLFALVSSGAGIVISQKLGAGEDTQAKTVASMSVAITLGIGVVVSVVLYVFADPVVDLLQAPKQLHALASQYVGVVGAGTIAMAGVLTLGTMIRSTGNTKAPMYVAIGMNIVHILGNYAFIFGAFGLPKLGLYGVALSTVGSRCLALIVLYWVFSRSFHTPIRIKEYTRFDRSLLKEIMRVGFPMGLSSASWTVSQVVIFSMVATMGVEQLAARTYLNTMESFSFLAGWSFAMAVQIQVAHLYGAGEWGKAYKSAFRALFWGEVVVVSNTVLLLLLGKPILSIFTENADIVKLGIGILILDLVLQPLKMLNMPLGNSLNAVGDTRYVMVISMISMWGVAVAGTWLFGLKFGYLVYGVYAAMILDEAIRGILSLRRWRRRKFLPGENNSQRSAGSMMS